MNKKIVMLLAVAVGLALVSGCATMPPAPAKDLNPMLRSGERVQKTNNFEVILDSSASMEAPHGWIQTCVSDQTPGTSQAPLAMQTNKRDYEVFLAQLFNDTIPDLKLTAGLRDFAGEHWMGRDVETKLWYGMAPWMKKDYSKAIGAIKTYGVESPLDKALDAATVDLKPLAGKSAVIVFSDGLDMPKAPASAQAMKAAMGDNVCIWAVQIGKEPAGKALLEQVVKAGQCGALVNASEIESPEGMAGFVERVFLGPPAMAAAGPAPVFPPSALPPGIPGKLDTIYFDFDKYNIKPEFKDAMKKNADWLQANKDYNVRIEGNCDERGTNEYNMALGQRRADAAMKSLMSLGIGKDRISTVSYGEEKPVCTEQTEDCWSRNRRDDFVVVKP
ncbi:MAG TPA: peptidoglycan-associated lipoprotein Pal [Syntrophales bacterium]|nr:peptidoglycan-associated lipoprotein Pal [Syntrophales bacterium]